MPKICFYPPEKSRTLPILFLYENSLSIDKNEAITDLIRILADSYKENASDFVELEFAIFPFPSDTNFAFNDLKELEDNYNYEYRENSEIYIDTTLEILNQNFRRKRLISEDSYLKQPIIILFSDGSSVYECGDALDNIFHSNKFYRNAEKNVISFGEPNLKTRKFFIKFSSNTGKVLTINDEKSDRNFLFELASVFTREKENLEEFCFNNQEKISIEYALPNDEVLVDDWDEQSW